MRTRRSLRIAAALLACCGLAASAGLAGAADSPVEVNPGFGAVSLPVPMVSGSLGFRARRAWVWRVEEGRGPATIRVVLDGDVESMIGGTTLRSRRASVWLRPLGVGGVGDAAGVYEVFGYFEDVDSPGGPASYGFSAETLPVEALVTANESVRLVVDSRRTGRPSGSPETESFNSRAERSFVETIERIRNPVGVGDQRADDDRALRPPAWILERRVPGRAGGDGGGGGGPAEDSLPERAPDSPDGSGGTEGVGLGETGGEGDGVGVVRGSMGGERAGSRSIPFRADASRSGRYAGDRTRSGKAPAGRAGGGRTAGIENGGAEPEASAEPGEGALTAAVDRIFSSDGVFFFSAGDSITIESGEEANALTLAGGVVIQHEGADRVVEMTARRAVLFLDPGPLDQTLGRTDVSDVRGIYLEGGVRVTDGGYTLRSPRVYYDVRSDRAMLVDAVFRTYYNRARMPLYMRAEVIRQEAASRFSAEKAVYANTAFAEPHFSLGTTRMTIEDRPAPAGEGDGRRIVEARGVTMRGGGVPFFWWPWYRGDPEQFPLRSVGFSDNNITGTRFHTGWDPFTLLGIERPDGFDATADLDYYTDRGIAFGGLTRWNRENIRGEARGYFLPDDAGLDVLRNGTRVDRDGGARGLLAFRQQWRLRPAWDLQLDGFYASDEKLLPALFRRMGEQEQELTTRAYLRRIEGNSFLTLEAKAATTDFIANENLAQAPGYLVDKLPEIDFGSIGTDPFRDRVPFYLMHTWNASATRMRMRFQEITPSDIGLRNPIRSNQVFGVDPTQPIADAARDAGLNEDWVSRVDTRQEFATKFDVGPIVVNPFVVGRFTGYDTDFDSFNAAAGNSGGGDEFRLWGAAGVTMSTSVFRVDDAVDSRVFDLHRMRHIIEPTVTLWHAGTTVDDSELPVYDTDVESLLEGSAVRVGLNQTWQTKRGGPGRWRSVDVFTLNLEYVWHSDDAFERSTVGRYYTARPELGSAGEFVRAAGTWKVSEVVGIGAETIWDVRTQREDRNSLLLDVRHSEDLRSRVEFRQLESQNDTYLNGSLAGSFGDKYQYIFNGTYNFRLEDFQSVNMTVLREFPVGRFGATITYNNITGETGFGLVVQPTGTRRSGLGGNGLLGG